MSGLPIEGACGSEHQHPGGDSDDPEDSFEHGSFSHGGRGNMLLPTRRRVLNAASCDAPKALSVVAEKEAAAEAEEPVGRAGLTGVCSR